MPELPEVETIVRRLKQGTEESPSLLGCTVSAVHLFWEKSLENSSEFEVQQRLVGQTLTDIQRRGKFSLFQFNQDYLLFHLRMSGEIFSEYERLPSDERLFTPKPHTRFILEFSDGKRMVFVDPRKFGRLWLTSSPQEIVGGLGPEPLDPALTPGMFFENLQKHHRQLKPLLLDQTFLAGLGNIYTDESLYLAKLHPLQLASLLSFDQAKNLLDSIRMILQQAIQQNGSSIDWVYRNGNFQNTFRVYHRTGEPCLNCGTAISRILVGQRSTHFCPNCQKL